ncbi:MAG: caspase family protein [Deltaproteobacteria bacterium]|jgi:hypothetical protein|nr:caspase family protein [Deltaproteobacteria bacterium]
MRTARAAKAPFRRAAALLAPLAALALALALPQAAAADKHALLIGINAYPDNPNFRQLTGALNDVELMRGVLVERLQYPEGNITALVDRQATRTGVIDAMTALAGSIAEGDEVYIHYSGHGSTTCDLSGDEARTVESTLVTYGSRSGAAIAAAGSCAAPNESEARAAARLAASDPDDYDLTDDRIRQLVAGLRRRAGLVVMVSDTCHSAAITRVGDALPTRGVPIDGRVNPDAFLEPPPDAGSLGSLISISAAGMTEKAVEYSGAGNGKNYGAFTWAWAQALQAARPPDTWSHVLDRTRAYLNERKQGARHPVFEETSPFPRPSPRQVFADGKGGSRAFTVLQTLGPSESGGKKRAIVNAGILAGVTPGTVFVKGDPKAPAARLTVARSSELQSMCEVTEGEAARGDDVELFSWAPGGMSIKVRYRADLPGDEGLLPQARAIFEGMTMVEEASDPAEADVAVWILRPPAQAAAAPSDGSAPADGASPPQPAPFLPPSDPAAPPEIWLVSAAEDSFLWGFERLRAPLEGDGPDRLRANFIQAAQAHNLMTLPSPPGRGPEVLVSYLIMFPADQAEWQAAPKEARFPQEDTMEGRYWTLSREVAADSPSVMPQDGENLVVVKAENRSRLEYCVYALNVNPAAQIVPFVPALDTRTSTEVPAGATRVFHESALLLEHPAEYVRVIVTQIPFAVTMMAQPEFALLRTWPIKASAPDTLSDLLIYGMTLTRGPISAGSPASWSTSSTTFGQ